MEKLKHNLLKTILISLTVILWPGGFAMAADIYVATPVTATTINAAITSASAGDTVIIPDGTYDDIGTINVNKSGCVSGTELTLKAATPGGVKFTGNVKFYITEDYQIIQDIRFEDAWPSSSQYMIELSGCDHSRITNCSFVNCGTDAYTYPYLIGLRYGMSYNRVDHCYFKNLNAVAISIKPYNGAYGPCVYNQVDYNYFKDIINSPSSICVQIATDQWGEGSIEMNTTVEYNLFDNCVGGMPVENKSAKNIIRYNVFKNGEHLGLRGGKNCTVESNYFFNNDTGIKFYGTGHIIKNNYIEGTTGYFAIWAPGGDGQQPSGYQDTYNCSVINNTIKGLTYGNGILLGGKAIPPHDLTFKNNIVESNAGQLVYYITTYGNPSDITYITNLHYATGTASYGITDAGITQATPNLTHDGTLYRLQATSTNAIAHGTVDTNVTDDIDGHARDGSTPDIGCDEYSASAPVRVPITEDDVGPTWMGNSCTENWICEDWSDWSDCLDNQQFITRTCTDSNECGTEDDKPKLIETQDCEILPTYNLTDFITLVSDWLKSETNLTSDLNNDNTVNTRDLGIMMSHWE